MDFADRCDWQESVYLLKLEVSQVVYHLNKNIIYVEIT